MPSVFVAFLARLLLATSALLMAGAWIVQYFQN